MTNNKIKKQEIEQKEVLNTKVETTQQEVSTSYNVALEELNQSAKQLIADVGMKAFQNALSETRNRDVEKALFNAKSVKMTFTADFIEFLSKIYASKMILCEMMRIFSSNQRSYMNAKKELNQKLEEKVLNDGVKEEIEEIQKQIQEKEYEIKKAQKAYQYARRKNLQEQKTLMVKVSDDIYTAYSVKGHDGGKSLYEAIREFLEQFDIPMNASIFSCFKEWMGAKATKDSRFYKSPITEMNMNESKKLFIHILLEIALQKKQISKRQMESVYNPEIIQDFTEYCDKVVVIEPSRNTTVEEYKSILDSVGIEYPKSANKNALKKLYEEGLENEIFLEIQR